MLHEINHPAIGNTTIYGTPHIKNTTPGQSTYPVSWQILHEEGPTEPKQLSDLVKALAVTVQEYPIIKIPKCLSSFQQKYTKNHTQNIWK